MEEGSGGAGQDQGSSDVAFFDKNETREKLALITTSTWASFKSPTSEFQKIVNILCVSLKSKMADTQHEKGGKSCPILSIYREILNKDQISKDKILREHLAIAFQNIEKEKEKDLGHRRRQMSMKDFFQKAKTMTQTQTPRTTQLRGNLTVHEEQPESQIAAGTLSDPVAKGRNQTNLQKLFSVLQISGQASTVEKSLKILSQDSDKLVRTIDLLQKLLRLLKTHEEKSAWTQKKSMFAVEKRKFLDDFDALKTNFEKLVQLCDRGQDTQKSEELSFAEFTAYLSAKAKEADNLCKNLFLQINGADFRKKMSSLIHKLQKQISQIESHKEAGTKKQIEITCGRSYASMMKTCLLY